MLRQLRLHKANASTAIACFALTCLALASGCSRESAKDANAVQVQLNWYPESEHGGLYQALAQNSYQDAGLEVSIQPGGRATPVGPELELGRAQFAVANADDVMIFRAQGLDVVAVMAAMQNHPRCIIARKDSGVESFEDLGGKTFQRQAGRAFVEFLRAKHYLDDVQEVPYHGSIASMVADPNIVIQGYSCAEPLLAQQQGIEVNTLMVSELGFNPYSSVLVTTGKLIRENPERIQKFVTATREGWKEYLTDSKLGNEAILSVNEQGMTPEALQFGAEVMRELAMPAGAPIDSVGTMTDERWKTLYDQLVELNVIEADKVTAKDCYTLEFLK
ncbi:ABC transporter substrate-binding protein [Rhodopirellula sp. MGV]|uniref:ABC transporter substrate-binding protein n=1 Tax=Rhodopirellula sp. MGV TaxID=2023130 RepID=UPI000B967FE8|nr:ABC transporter substrate-binding protein [Rhodopirellula sp. MGV]OYP36750.1 ABC transporter permease [Rhodopirellula sp. MGV]PNY34443.1 ABC transporter permease [Rhodopirellula baltica]